MPEHPTTGPNVASLTFRGGRPLHLRSDNEMYQRLVGLEAIPALIRPPKGPQVSLSIETDHFIKVDERIIKLTGHRLFLLNALLMSLGRSITRKDAIELGFAPGATAGRQSTAFSTAQISLQKELICEARSKTLLLQKFDSSQRAHYQLDPDMEYVFFDRRTEQK